MGGAQFQIFGKIVNYFKGCALKIPITYYDTSPILYNLYD